MASLLIIITYVITWLLLIITYVIASLLHIITNSLLPIITVIMESLLPIITRSIIGNNGFIITYYWPGQLEDSRSTAASDRSPCADCSPSRECKASFSHVTSERAWPGCWRSGPGQRASAPGRPMARAPQHAVSVHVKALAVPRRWSRCRCWSGSLGGTRFVRLYCWEGRPYNEAVPCKLGIPR